MLDDDYDLYKLLFRHGRCIKSVRNRKSFKLDAQNCDVSALLSTSNPLLCYDYNLNSSKTQPITRSIFVFRSLHATLPRLSLYFHLLSSYRRVRNFKTKFHKPHTNCNLSRKRMALLAGGDWYYRTMDGLTTKLFIRHEDRETEKKIWTSQTKLLQTWTETYNNLYIITQSPQTFPLSSSPFPTFSCLVKCEFHFPFRSCFSLCSISFSIPLYILNS